MDLMNFKEKSQIEFSHLLNNFYYQYLMILFLCVTFHFGFLNGYLNLILLLTPFYVNH